MRVAAVILAAGMSKRYGDQKLLATLDGRPLLQHVVDAANASSADDVIVVVGHAARDVLGAVRLSRARAVTNPDHAQGQSTSLRLGIRAASGSDAVVIMLGDQPRVTGRLIDALITRAGETGARAAMCAWEGHRSAPTFLHRDVWPDLEAISGDTGAREVLAARDDVAVLDVEGLGSLDDVDRPTDLARIARAGRIHL